jgi:hypothetical protein
MTWKQFWCRHIWKLEEKEYLRSETWRDYDGGEKRDYDFYAVQHECIKCHRTRIKEMPSLQSREFGFKS